VEGAAAVIIPTQGVRHPIALLRSCSECSEEPPYNHAYICQGRNKEQVICCAMVLFL
jgi:hypothetical protein